MTKPSQCLAAVWLLSTAFLVSSFSVPHQGQCLTQHRQHRQVLYALSSADEDQQPKTIKAASFADNKPLISDLDDNNNNNNGNADDNVMEEEAAAMTGTINDRLLAELQQAADQEKYGPKSGVGKKLRLGSRQRKSPEEYEAALQEARDLNGVNPLVALGGGVFAVAVAAALWYATTLLGTFFALHPVETDVYFVQRLAAVFRNIAMGLVSLASGFFGVTGMGIFLLGVRVAVGVAQGELDPTPIVKKKQSTAEGDLELPNVWDLMMNKKPRRRGGRTNGDDDNPFGL